MAQAPKSEAAPKAIPDVVQAAIIQAAATLAAVAPSTAVEGKGIRNMTKLVDQIIYVYHTRSDL